MNEKFQPINLERLPGGKNDAVLLRLYQMLDMALTLPQETLQEVAEQISDRRKHEIQQAHKTEPGKETPETVGADIAYHRILALNEFVRHIQSTTAHSLSLFEDVERAKSLSAAYFMEPFTPNPTNHDER